MKRMKRLWQILVMAFCFPVYLFVQAGNPLMSGDYDTEFKDLDVEPEIYKLCKDASPFAVILNKMSKETTDQEMVTWYESEPGSRWTQSRGGDLNNAVIWKVDDASAYVIGDTTAVMSSSGAVLETARVTAKDVTVGANTITVAGRALTGAAQVVADDQWILNMGNTSEENSLAPDSNNTLPVKKYNYIEESRKTFDGSDLSKLGLKVGETSRQYLTGIKLMEHMQDLENKVIAGQRLDDTANNRRYMGGILYYMAANSYNAGGILTESNFDQNFCEKLFKYDKRPAVLVCGPRVISAISGWAKGKLVVSDPKETYGLKLNWYQSPHGMILLVPSLSFDNAWSGMGLGLHMQNIKLVTHKGIKARLERNIQENGRHGFKDGHYSLTTLKYMLDKTHCKLTGVTG